MELHPRASQHERIEIVAALNIIAAPGLMPFLRRRLADPTSRPGGWPRTGWPVARRPRRPPSWWRWSNDADWTVRNHAAWGMGRLGLPLLRELLLLLCPGRGAGRGPHRARGLKLGAARSARKHRAPPDEAP